MSGDDLNGLRCRQIKALYEAFNDRKLEAKQAILDAIERAYDTTPSLDKRAVGNEMNDGYDQGVEAFRHNLIKELEL